MKKLSKFILSVLLWFFGGTLYFFMEVIFKTATDKTESISWTMLLLAIFLTIFIERCGCELPWKMPLFFQSLICASIVTFVEFFAGLIINVWLNLNVWDYSNMPFNIFGQICPQFCLIWLILCFVFIPVFDWIRWSIEGGEKPKYTIFKMKGGG